MLTSLILYQKHLHPNPSMLVKILDNKPFSNKPNMGGVEILLFDEEKS